MVQTNSYCRGFRKNKLNETDQTVFKLQNKNFSQRVHWHNALWRYNMKDNTERITKGVTKQGSVV